ncbi:hypothetical protein BJ742DRAFT_74061 [Cladochytrium replicatum]|nr:hypothetical protein BJ742DRAFT_74061 [Cladochytrium replicatum]
MHTAYHIPPSPSVKHQSRFSSQPLLNAQKLWNQLLGPSYTFTISVPRIAVLMSLVFFLALFSLGANIAELMITQSCQCEREVVPFSHMLHNNTGAPKPASSSPAARTASVLTSAAVIATSNRLAPTSLVSSSVAPTPKLTSAIAITASQRLETTTPLSIPAAGTLMLNSTVVSSTSHPPAPKPTNAVQSATKPWLTASGSAPKSLIPQLIFQKWMTNNKYNISDQEHRVRWYKSWETLNPGFVQILYDDNDAARFITSEYPGDIAKAYFMLPLTVQRSDLLRYLVSKDAPTRSCNGPDRSPQFLLKFGGYYNDMDTLCLKPIKAWIPSTTKTPVGFIAGLEWDDGFDRQNHSFQQWTFASTPGHPILHNLVNHIVTDILATPLEKLRIVDDTIALTGPRIFTKVVDEYARSNGAKGEDYGKMIVGHYQVADLLVFGVTSFAPKMMNAKGTDHPDAKLQHMFSGLLQDGWRFNGEQGVAKESMPTDLPKVKRHYGYKDHW